MFDFIKKQIDIISKLLFLYKDLLRLKQNEEMVRKVCEEKGLSSEETELLCKVIECESGFDDRTICDNGTSKDFGICQFNNYWYWTKEQIIHPDEALNNPEKAIGIMIDMYKKGRLKDWVCYNSGKYFRYSGKI
jgi:hypothetical protein